MNPLWSMDECKRLAELWPKHSASEIGAILDRSRNAIIGMVHRMKLPPKKEIKRTGGRAKGQTKQALIAKVTIKASPPTQPWSGPSVPLLDAKSDQCRAVVGSTNDSRGLATVCGDKIVEGQTYSFCAYHLSKFTQPPRGR